MMKTTRTYLLTLNIEGGQAVDTTLTPLNLAELLVAIREAANYLDHWEHDPDQCGYAPDEADSLPCMCGLNDVRTYLQTGLNLLDQTTGA
ncbi:MAG: hypothetical protein GY934_01655 [Gammaproteobacteria bacterium]|nr:hypothetical protein [Gammaproteobacteria bacterium]